MSLDNFRSQLGPNTAAILVEVTEASGQIRFYSYKAGYIAFVKTVTLCEYVRHKVLYHGKNGRDISNV